MYKRIILLIFVLTSCNTFKYDDTNFKYGECYKTVKLFINELIENKNNYKKYFDTNKYIDCSTYIKNLNKKYRKKKSIDKFFNKVTADSAYISNFCGFCTLCQNSYYEFQLTLVNSSGVKIEDFISATFHIYYYINKDSSVKKLILNDIDINEFRKFNEYMNE
jgi:hypothetical protein